MRKGETMSLAMREKLSKIHLEAYKNGRKTWHEGTRGVKKSNSGSFKKGCIPWIKGREAYWQMGDKNPRWNGGIIQRDKHSWQNPEYIKWRTDVFTRDNFKCKMANDKCTGCLEAHHILPWRDYPEERFNINNGITLCYYHHPRKREEVKNLAPIFINILSQVN